MKSILFSKKAFAAAFSLVAVLSLLMVAVTPALAMATDPGTPSGALTDSKAEAMLHHALTVYNATVKSKLFENNSLDTTMQYVRQRESNSGAGKGHYGTFTPAQYAGLFANLAQVNSLMSMIKALTDTHPGFDKYGDVVTSAVASDTAKEINGYASALQYYTIKSLAGLNQLQHSK